MTRGPERCFFQGHGSALAERPTFRLPPVANMGNFKGPRPLAIDVLSHSLVDAKEGYIHLNFSQARVDIRILSLAKALSVILSPMNSLVTVYFKTHFCFDASPLYMGVGEINIGLLAWTAQF